MIKYIMNTAMSVDHRLFLWPIKCKVFIQKKKRGEDKIAVKRGGLHIKEILFSSINDLSKLI